MSELLYELPHRVLLVYDVEFPDRKTKRKAIAILKGHQKYPCGAPTMGFLVVDGKEYTACAEMMEVFGIAERRLGDELEAPGEGERGQRRRGSDAGPVAASDAWLRHPAPATADPVGHRQVRQAIA
jgi:hypothetical protein